MLSGAYNGPQCEALTAGFDPLEVKRDKTHSLVLCILDSHLLNLIYPISHLFYIT